MQKVKEFLEKNKELQELVPDLIKNPGKSVCKMMEMTAEILLFEPSWNLNPENLELCVDKLRKLSDLLVKTVKSLPSGSYSIDFNTLEPQILSIFSHKWSVLHPLAPTDYDIFKSSTVSFVCKFIRELLKVLGTSSVQPKIMRIVKNSVQAAGMSVSSNKVLISFLRAVGSFGTELVLEYFNLYEIPSKIIKQLTVITCEEKITLGPCHKNKAKKIGNCHQRKHHKVVMKKIENKILKNVVEGKTENFDPEFVETGLALFAQYLISSPQESFNIEQIFNVPVSKLPANLQYSVIEVAFYYAISYKKLLKKTRVLLQSMLKDINFRNTSRHYLFLLDTMINS